jgi:hypothetical protein
MADDSAKQPVITCRHPDFSEDSRNFLKFRLAYKGGVDFIQNYMFRLSDKERESDFDKRKSMAYCPRFAAAAVNDVKNSIYQRTVDVVRDGGPTSYQAACKGLLGGVDMGLSQMNSFIGMEVLKELLIQRRVGVLVDNHDDLGVTIKDKGERHPYLGVYTYENILNWQWTVIDNSRVLKSVLLMETLDVFNEYDLPNGQTTRYRLMRLNSDGGIDVIFFDAAGDEERTVKLRNKRIPFAMAEIPVSLMQDVADYQIALMNIESSDLSFIRVANFPMYYEFFDPRSEPQYKMMGPPTDTGKVAEQQVSKNVETEMGLTKGRRFPKDVQNPPGFISPDADTLRVSMEKGAQLKDDIRLIVNLNLSNIHPTRSSAESKDADMAGLESSLSYIGLVLEKMENEIGYFWSEFEGESQPPKVIYPRNYKLKTDAQRYEEAEKISKLMHKVPSNTFKRQLAVKLAKILIASDVKDKTLEEIITEIEKAKTLTTDPNEVLADHKEGLVSDALAAEIRGYPAEDIEQAKKDRVEKLKEIAESQGGQVDQARGGIGGGASSSDEKEGKDKRGTADKVVTDE